ncbi:MAG: ACP S-malonyltransferase [Planctomycetota bacterium]|nr:ACP S-malonyltransferase [Planctomycetota bacterium]
MSTIGFLFPGQGAQHVGMGKSLAENYPAARALFDKANDILGYDLAQLCFDGPAEKLDTTEVSQPAIYVASLAALEMLRAEQSSLVESCSLTAGLSLGEYTALVFAGVMSFEDGLKVVKCRGEAMQAASEKTPSGMVSALLLEDEQIEAICRQASEVGEIRIANRLCPSNRVLSGTKAACTRAMQLIEEAGGRFIELTVAGAFHTNIMKPADDQLAAVLAETPFASPRIPVYSNVDAATHSDPDEIRKLLVRQVISPVLWEDSMRLMTAAVDEFYEIGPGKVLKGLMKRIDRKKPFKTVNDAGIL